VEDAVSLNGSLGGPPPIRNQVRSLPVQVDYSPPGVPPGHWRVSTPLARGWAAVVSNPHDLARALVAAATEAQIASYARLHSQPYELDVLTDVVPGDPLAQAHRTVDHRRRVRTDQHHPGDWVPMPDGRWRAPCGRMYRPDSGVVRRVKAARLRLGIDLPLSPPAATG
jgi:hypothetical protein